MKFPVTLRVTRYRIRRTTVNLPFCANIIFGLNPKNQQRDTSYERAQVGHPQGNQNDVENPAAHAFIPKQPDGKNHRKNCTQRNIDPADQGNSKRVFASTDILLGQHDNKNTDGDDGRIQNNHDTAVNLLPNQNLRRRRPLTRRKRFCRKYRSLIWISMTWLR